MKLKELVILKEEIERKLRSKRVHNLNDDNTAQNNRFLRFPYKGRLKCECLEYIKK